MSHTNLNKCAIAVKIALVVGTTALAMPVMAQQPAKAPAGATTEAVEVIQVRGIRRSLAESVATKRLSNAVVDAVSAEDIGKFPDADIGEALGRIPGVTVSRQFGQGQQVSIRGASNQLTLTTLNGQSVASTGWYDQQAIDRSFNYSLLPPQMISGIEVFKSSQADLVEGGVGGTVNVKTRKPLDLESGTTFLSAEGNYGSVSEETDPALSALTSWKNQDETFGFIVAGAFEDTAYMRRGTEALYGWGGSFSVNNFEQARERKAIDFAAQFRPNDKLDMGVHVLSLDLTADNTNTSVFMFQHGKFGCQVTRPDGVCVYANNNAASAAAFNSDPKNVAEKATVGSSYLQTFSRAASMSSNTIDLDFTYTLEQVVLSGRVGKTDAEGGTDLTTNHGNFIGKPSDTFGVWDATGKQLVIDFENTPAWTAANVNGPVSLSGWAEASQPNTDEETYAQLDARFPVELGAVTHIKTGVRATSHDVTDRKNRAIYKPTITAVNANTLWQGTTLAGMQHLQVPRPNMKAMHADARANITGWFEDRSGYGTVSEDNIAAYVMADYQAEDVRGNFGVRFVSTDASSDYYAPRPGFVDPVSAVNNNLSNTITTDNASYNDILPSFNLAYDAEDNVVVRFSLAQVMARPNYVDMFSKSAVAGLNDNDPTNQSITRGNVGLKPYKATQSDISLEYYYDNSNMLAATLFVKKVNDFTTFTAARNQKIGVIDNGCNCDNWTVNSKINGNGGDIKGLELQWQHTLKSGFGAQANYTFADSYVDAKNFADRVTIFSDSSKHSVNLVGFYERGDFMGRLAYNWRSEYMIRETGFYGNRYHDDFGTLDLTSSYTVNDYVTVRFEVVNLLAADSVQYGAAAVGVAGVGPDLRAGFPAWTFEGETRYAAGVDVRF